MLVDKIIAYETGELSEIETAELFAELIKSGRCWTLQGHYGRMAKGLMDNGIISKDGVINYDLLNDLLN